VSDAVATLAVAMRAQLSSSPRVTVIIPCFNDGASLETAVESALAQEDIELLVVDDGSTDHQTLETFARLERRGIHVLHKQNSGPGQARMAGVNATTARYVTYLDADDLLPPGALTSLADALDGNAALGAAWGDYEMFGDVTTCVRTPDGIDPWRQTYINELPGPALFRRDELLAVGGWSLDIGYEDWGLWLALAERGCRGTRVALVTYRYRVHGQRGWHVHSGRHQAIVAELCRRHPVLFASRRQNWARSSAPWRLKLGLPIVSAVPLPTPARLAIMHALSNPRAVAHAAFDRRLTKAARALGLRV
jgi:glycosyltransferase involved in cell wall biosynthesis